MNTNPGTTVNLHKSKMSATKVVIRLFFAIFNIWWFQKGCKFIIICHILGGPCRSTSRHTKVAQLLAYTYKMAVGNNN